MSFLEISKTVLKHATLSEMMRPRKSCQHGYTGGIAALTGSPWEINTIDENLVSIRLQAQTKSSLVLYGSPFCLAPQQSIQLSKQMCPMHRHSSPNEAYISQIIRKDGDLDGYSSTMALVPDLKLAFNVLMSGTRGENVARKVLQKVIPVFRDILRRLVASILYKSLSHYRGR